MYILYTIHIHTPNAQHTGRTAFNYRDVYIDSNNNRSINLSSTCPNMYIRIYVYVYQIYIWGGYMVIILYNPTRFGLEKQTWTIAWELRWVENLPIVRVVSFLVSISLLFFLCLFLGIRHPVLWMLFKRKRMKRNENEIVKEILTWTAEKRNYKKVWNVACRDPSSCKYGYIPGTAVINLNNLINVGKIVIFIPKKIWPSGEYKTKFHSGGFKPGLQRS